MEIYAALDRILLYYHLGKSYLAGDDEQQQ